MQQNYQSIASPGDRAVESPVVATNGNHHYDEKNSNGDAAISKRLLMSNGDEEDVHKSPYRNGYKRQGSIRPVLQKKPAVFRKIIVLLSVATTILLFLIVTLVTKDIIHVGPRKEPTGPYKLLEVQVQKAKFIYSLHYFPFEYFVFISI